MNAKKIQRGGAMTALFGACLVLAGCGSINNMVREHVNPVNGEPIYREPVVVQKPVVRNPDEERAEQLYKATVDDLRSLVSYVTDKPDAAVGEVHVDRVANTVSVRIGASTAGKGFFPPGVYSLRKIVRSEDRGGLVYSELVVNHIKSIVAHARQLGVDVELTATYAAQSDNMPVRNLKYLGDFGPVHLSPDNTFVNGKPADITVAPQQAIDNVQLTALRAVSMYAVMHAVVKDIPIRDKFVLTTSSAKGPDSRWVQMDLKIVPKS